MKIGLGLSLTSLNRSRFNPLSVSPVVWYDPSDLSTMFQDSAGTTPVTADSDPVGLILDKSAGLVFGSESVTNGTFDAGSTGYTEVINGTVSYASLTMLATGTTGNTGVYQDVGVGAGVPQSVAWSQVSGSNIRINIYDGASFSTSLYNNGSGNTDVGEKSAIVIPSTGIIRIYAHTSSGNTAEFDNISVREIPGNHWLQSTAASRPLYKTSGGLHWLETDGVDDGLSASGITWVDDAIACIGVRPGVDNQFLLGSSSTSGTDWFGVAQAATTTTHDFSSAITGRVDGVALANNQRQTLLTALPNNTNKIVTFEQMDFLTEWPGTLNFGNYTDYEIAGRLYGYIIAPAVSAAERSQLEFWMAAKSGVTL